jgi:hypothetical protein
VLDGGKCIDVFFVALMTTHSLARVLLSLISPYHQH